MALAAGTTLGHYEVQGLIGKGGMGEVYRARDMKLEREVALKLLPPEFARDPERLARFRREATMLAALNHSNIAQIYGVEQTGETHFLVMEYVPGLTLAEMIRDSGIVPRGEAPTRDSGSGIEVDEALRISSQICEALEHAHEKNIIHRDLKPANVKVTPEGKVKVLDFGLAKAYAGEGAAGSAPLPVIDSNSPTLSKLPEGLAGAHASPTIPGVILGTAAYMSPEQAKGKAVDRRTDIWALGCVLYELLTAKRAFDGESVTEILGAVMRGEPEWPLLPAETPAAVRALLRRCLRKDAQQRPKDAGDVRLEIDDARAAAAVTVSQTVVAPAPVPSNKLRERLAWAVAAVAVVAAVALVYLQFRPAPTTPNEAIRFSITPPGDAAVLGPQLAVSTDGTHVAFVATDANGKNLLWTRSMDTPTAQPLPGTEGSQGVFWSPDSKYIGFFADGKLKTILASGGPVKTLTAAYPRGGTWNREGIILYSTDTFGALERIAATGGVSTPVSTLDAARGERAHRWPQFLPDGRYFLFQSFNRRPEDNGIYVGSLDSKETKRLVSTSQKAEYAPPGYLLFMNERTLMAQSFDVARLVLSGEPVVVADGLSTNMTAGSAGFSASEGGLLAYWTGGATGATSLQWLSREGKMLGMVELPGVSNGPELAPDEKRVAMEVGGGGQPNDIWLLDLSRNISTRLTTDPANERFARWAPDGSRLLFQSNRNSGSYDFYQRPSNGFGNDELVFQSDDSKYPYDWSSDGRFVVYAAFGTGKGTTSDLWVLPLAGDHKPIPFMTTKFVESQARFSPDGRWIAVVSNESGTDEVYVSSFPTASGKIRISTNGGVQPRWRRDGKELFYLSPDRKLMAVPMAIGAAIEAGPPKALFDVHLVPRDSSAPNAYYQYDVTRDGQRFLVNTPLENATVPITVVLNWTAALKK
ncbi:MAG: serine/threonine-protein kinase [Acidobacteria bacterium]|nr:serine/threonine-protein kinase [Acidobacteriota bacterium]